MLNMRGRNQPSSSPSLESYAAAVEQILPAIGIDPLAARMNTEGGYGWSFQRGSAVIEVYVSQQDSAGYLQVLSPIMHLPMSNLLPLYRHLLELNLQLTAAAVGVHLDVVYVFSERPLQGMDATEANTIINLVSGYADELDDRLVSEFGGRLYAKVNG
ncbi:MAG: YbjN domain-containing protein [Anaerolineae bacterium]|nr:YbjN domain-containing protein [Anaerolineae bacterium]